MQLAGPQYFTSLCNNGNNNNVFVQASSEPGFLSYLGKKRE